MTTKARYDALAWFAAHEEPDGVTRSLFKKAPTARMRRLMAREGHLYRKPVGQFGYEGWLLTEAGYALLAAKMKPRQDDERDQPAQAS